MLVRNLDPIHAELLAEVPDVFAEGLGKLKELQVKINVKRGTIRRFFKARPIPYALKEKVENELDKKALSNQCNLQNGQHRSSRSASPMARYGSVVTIYKVTINRSVVEDKYPLPRVNDLYASLAGGESFTKLDLSHAYLQLPLDEGSRDYVTINTHSRHWENPRRRCRESSIGLETAGRSRAEIEQSKV